MCNLFSCDCLRSFSVISRASSSGRPIFYQLCSCRLVSWNVCNAIWEPAKEENQNNTQTWKTNMKTFTSFWFLHSPVKGNFILIWVDGKSVKVITAYQKKPHKVRDIASLALQLIKGRQQDGCLLFVPWTWISASGHHSDKRLSAPSALSSLRGPHHRRKAAFHQKSENVNEDAFMLFMTRYLWQQESRPAGLLGPFQTSAPAERKTHLLQTSFPLPMLPLTPKQLIYKNIYQQTILNI